MSDKIKITLYFDIFPAQTDFAYLTATTTPGGKIEGWKRYGFEVWIDNPAEADELIPPEKVTKVDSGTV